MRDTNDGGWVSGAPAHLVSSAFVTQSSLMTFFVLARAAALFVIHVNIAFMV
jgi:hypothetical protein